MSKRQVVYSPKVEEEGITKVKEYQLPFQLHKFFKYITRGPLHNIHMPGMVPSWTILAQLPAQVTLLIVFVAGSLETVCGEEAGHIFNITRHGR